MRKKENVEILGRCGVKYTDKSGIEYFVDGEMVAGTDFDFALYSVKFYDDYLNKQDSNFSNNETKKIIERVIELHPNKARMKYIPPK